jgi:uncharacterized SAM-binding protein YcdF (DUF218 family)
MIMRVRTGSHFYIIWSVIGIVLVAVGIGLKTGFFGKLPRGVNIALVAGTVCFILVIAGIIFRLVTYSANEPEKDLDYIIVLGAQVKKEGPSVVLKYRLDTAAEYLKENPDTKCIVSGGKGSNEIVSEAEGMREYLVANGIGTERIILEDRSTDTDENIRFSKELIPEGSKIGLVTNDFHLYRAVYLCKKHGLPGVFPISAGSEAFYRPNNYFREALALIKNFIFLNVGFSGCGLD